MSVIIPGMDGRAQLETFHDGTSITLSASHLPSSNRWKLHTSFQKEVIHMVRTLRDLLRNSYRKTLAVRAQPTNPVVAVGSWRKRISSGIKPSLPKSKVCIRLRSFQSQTCRDCPYMPGLPRNLINYAVFIKRCLCTFRHVIQGESSAKSWWRTPLGRNLTRFLERKMNIA